MPHGTDFRNICPWTRGPATAPFGYATGLVNRTTSPGRFDFPVSSIYNQNSAYAQKPTAIMTPADYSRLRNRSQTTQAIKPPSPVYQSLDTMEGMPDKAMQNMNTMRKQAASTLGNEYLNKCNQEDMLGMEQTFFYSPKIKKEPFDEYGQFPNTSLNEGDPSIPYYAITSAATLNRHNSLKNTSHMNNYPATMARISNKNHFQNPIMTKPDENGLSEKESLLVADKDVDKEIADYTAKMNKEEESKPSKYAYKAYQEGSFV